MSSCLPKRQLIYLTAGPKPTPGVPTIGFVQHLSEEPPGTCSVRRFQPDVSDVYTAVDFSPAASALLHGPGIVHNNLSLSPLSLRCTSCTVELGRLAAGSRACSAMRSPSSVAAVALRHNGVATAYSRESGSLREPWNRWRTSLPLSQMEGYVIFADEGFVGGIEQNQRVVGERIFNLSAWLGQGGALWLSGAEVDDADVPMKSFSACRARR